MGAFEYFQPRISSILKGVSVETPGQSERLNMVLHNGDRLVWASLQLCSSSSSLAIRNACESPFSGVFRVCLVYSDVVLKAETTIL